MSLHSDAHLSRFDMKNGSNKGQFGADPIKLSHMFEIIK